MARPRQFTDEEILTAARKAFVDAGPGASTAVIAEAVGVSQAALFKRFGTKDQLMIAALAPPSVPPFVEILEAGPDDRPLCEQIHEIASAITAFFVQIVPRLSILRASGIDPKVCFEMHDVPPPLLAHRALSAWIERAIDAGLVRSVNPMSAATAFLGSLHARPFIEFVSGHKLPGPSMKVYVKDIVDLLCTALGTED